MRLLNLWPSFGLFAHLLVKWVFALCNTCCRNTFLLATCLYFLNCFFKDLRVFLSCYGTILCNFIVINFEKGFWVNGKSIPMQWWWQGDYKIPHVQFLWWQDSSSLHSGTQLHNLVKCGKACCFVRVSNQPLCAPLQVWTMFNLAPPALYLNIQYLNSQYYNNLKRVLISYSECRFVPFFLKTLWSAKL